MKNALIAVIVLVLLGGGYYFYSMQNASEAPAGEEMNNDAAGIQQTGDETGMPVEEQDAAGKPVIDAEVEVTVGGAVKEFTVTGNNFTFAPATMKVKKGDTVRITFKNAGGTHDLVIDEFNARTKIINGSAQETIEFVADKAGTFEYYCSVGQHRAMGMKGTLTVE